MPDQPCVHLLVANRAVVLTLLFFSVFCRRYPLCDETELMPEYRLRWRIPVAVVATEERHEFRFKDLLRQGVVCVLFRKALIHFEEFFGYAWPSIGALTTLKKLFCSSSSIGWLRLLISS